MKGNGKCQSQDEAQREPNKIMDTNKSSDNSSESSFE